MPKANRVIKSSLAPATLLLLLVAACSDAPIPADEEDAPPPANIAGATGKSGTAKGLTGGSAVELARAMGINNDASTDGFGLVAAELTRGFDDDSAPEAEQHGILTKFGDVLKPREGSTLGVLSTGFAQEFNGADGAKFVDGNPWWADTTRTALPAGYPKAADGCEQSKDLTDVIVLKLTLKAPQEGSGFKFDFNFHSSEWPAFICTSYNDGFLAYLTSKGRTGNISFDSKNNPVSVNNAFFDRCTPDAEIGCSGDAPSTSVCTAGTSELRRHRLRRNRKRLQRGEGLPGRRDGVALVVGTGRAGGDVHPPARDLGRR